MFGGIPDDALATISEALERIDVNANTVIVREGEMGDTMYILVSGSVKVHHHDFILSEIEAINVIGEVAITRYRA